MLLTRVSTKKTWLFGLLAVCAVSQAFATLAPPLITSFSPASGSVGTLVTISGTNLASPTALTIGGQTAIVISNTGSLLVAMVMPGATSGSLSLTTVDGTVTGGSTFTVTPTPHPGAQQGAKRIGTGGVGTPALGYSVSVSADGNTAAVGGYFDSSGAGAVWFYTRSGGTWTQQGPKMVGTGATGAAQQGYSVSLSADGNTAIVGGSSDNGQQGAVWFYTRSGGTWTQQGLKQVATGNIGQAHQGSSVSLSADGNTAIVGGITDNTIAGTAAGAAWVYTRSAGVWAQQVKLVGTGAVGGAQQGWSVSLSADGNTAIVGGYQDNTVTGAAWVYARSGSTWTQQGKLVGTSSVGPSRQGISVSLSADGNTAMVGGYQDNINQGAAWVYTRSGGTWTQQGSKLLVTGNTGAAQQGVSVSLSADGNTALVGGYADNTNQGAAWVYTRSAGTWTQQGLKLVGSGNTGAAQQGYSVSLSADGSTAIVGGYQDNTTQGAIWAYKVALPPVITSFSPASGPVGTLVTINGTDLDNLTALTIGGQPAIVISNTGSVLVAMVMPGAVTGAISLTTVGGSTTGGSNFTVTPTPFPSSQQGAKFTGTGNTGAAQQGYSVSMSADGATAVIGGNLDNNSQGAVWFYTRSGDVWTQQGTKQVATGNIGTAQQGISVSLSADGNTALVGGYGDNGFIGAAWVYTRSGVTWTQQGKLTGSGSSGVAGVGYSVSLSADGNTAMLGGYNDNNGAGAVWFYTRNGSTWTQQGAKLVGTGATGVANQGRSVSLSADGNTAMSGGNNDNITQGAAWVYTRTGNTWTQQGTKLVGTGNTGAAQQGGSVTLSADGNTALIGGAVDNTNVGAVWVYTRTGVTWTQQGSKLVGTGSVGAAAQGRSVSLSADGNTAMIGGAGDNGSAGAAWVYTRSGGTWTQHGLKLVGTGGSGTSQRGSSVALSADGLMAMIGAQGDNTNQGAVWTYKIAVPPTITSFSPASGPAGTLVTINGTDLENLTALTLGGQPAIAVSNTGSVLVALVMPGSTGIWSVTTVGGTATGGSFTVTPTPFPSSQQGAKFTGTGNTGAAQQGYSVSMSADGTTAVIGGNLDNNSQGAVWFYTRSGDVWTQQGTKLVGTGNIGAAQQGISVSMSADGNTALVGGYGDNSFIGAAWVFTRSGGTWTQQGKLTGSGSSGVAGVGYSVSLSGDGNTAMLGGYNDNGGAGAVWFYTRSGGVWAQQGLKQVGTGGTAARQGISVSLSADGNTAMAGGNNDNTAQGAAWVYTRTGGVWTQQGTKLVGSGNTGAAQQGGSVTLSADGNTALVGGAADDSNVGAVWVYTRSGNTWSQQGLKLVGTGYSGAAAQGRSLSLSADGNTAMIGGAGDNGNAGAVWVYTRSGGTWTQHGLKLVGTGGSGAAQRGSSVALSADGSTAMIGAPGDNTSQGAVWTYKIAVPPTITSFSPASGSVGTPVTINGTDLENLTALTIGGQTAIAVSNTGSVLVAMVMPGAVTGTLSVTTAGGTAAGGSSFTVTPTPYPYSQQGDKRVGTGNTRPARQGVTVSVSADGNTALVGGYGDNGSAGSTVGAAWVYIRSGGTWVQQGAKLVGTGYSGSNVEQGNAVALSADGNTALIGGNADNGNTGAVWVFTRSGGVWTQQGTKLVGTGGVGAQSQGYSVSLSADGNTALVGGRNDDAKGATWVFTRSGGVWAQQGAKLVGTGGGVSGTQGCSVSLSADGNTALIGSDQDNSSEGAAWVFTRGGSVWTQQAKLVGTGNTGNASQGVSVALSADGNTALIGGYRDNSFVGAAWIYTRSGGVWTQQSNKLVGTGNTGAARQGDAVSLSADGNTVIVGGSQDNGGKGAFWVYARSGGIWNQQGFKVVGTGAVGNASQSSRAAVSADGSTAFIGGSSDNNSQGAAWAYTLRPNIQAGLVTFTNTATTTTSASWINGNGAYRAVFVSQAINGVAAAIDATTYTANAAYGSGSQIGSTGWYCVYNGLGTTVNLTSLTAGTTYRVMVVEYNGVPGNEFYLTTPGTGNPAGVITGYEGLTTSGNSTTSGTTFVNANGRISTGAALTKFGQIMICPTNMIITHTSGTVAPATATISYDVVPISLSGTIKCWITRNLGAAVQATSTTDISDAASGWYWQFNRAKGYSSTGGAVSVPAWSNTLIGENSNWLPANDPCTLQLGAGWRIPTQTEWTGVTASWAGNFTNAYDSALKIHAAGYMVPPTGLVVDRGVSGHYWSATQSDNATGSSTGNEVMNSSSKVAGFTLRCLRD